MLWQSLNQPLFDSNVKTVFNPHRFWLRYRIQFLERCWQIDCIEFLDRKRNIAAPAVVAISAIADNIFL